MESRTLTRLNLWGLTRLLLTSLAFALGTTACGGGSSGPCSQRSGTYRFDWSERSGDCGAIAESIMTVDGQPASPPAPCTGEIRYSADNCDVTEVNIMCPETSVAGSTSTTNGKVTWSQDGSFGSGQLAIVVNDASGAILCQSSYDISATRL